MLDNLHKLILIKHAMPIIVRDAAPATFLLSDEGRERSRYLGEFLKSYQPHVVITSTEPKAVETGKIAAEVLGVSYQQMPNLHEHNRENERYDDDVTVFQRKVQDFFTHSAELTYGVETANAVQERFCTAVEAVLKAYPDQTIALVAHGTVISLFAAHYAGVDPMTLWKRLKLPSCVVFSLPELDLLEVVERV